MAHVRQGDMVVVISGIDGQGGEKTRGRVLSVDTDKQRIVVEGSQAKMVKHLKRGRVRQSQTGQRLTTERPMHISNVMLFCSKCDRGVRIRHRVDDQGRKVRVCAKCGADIPYPQVAKK